MSFADRLKVFEVSLREQAASLNAAAQEDASRAARSVSERLNRAGRRLRLAESVAAWQAILLEAASAFGSNPAAFSATQSSPAFAEVKASRETVVAVRDVSQLSASIFQQLGESESARCYLFPVLDSAGGVAVILYAEPGDGFDREGLELLAAVAGGTVPPPEVAPRAVSAVEYEARRMARVRVAEMILHYPRALRRGREEKKLYVLFQEQIDSGRADFQRFLNSDTSLADGLHEELVRTLARNDETAMGTEYPGALR